MTENQIQVILMTAKLGSISAAAKELQLSQPNASSCIRAVEEESGIQIFRRTRGGIEVTAGGALLLEQAQRIADAAGAIRQIREKISLRQFRLGTESYSASFNAFVKMCRLYGNEGNVNFQLFKTSLDQGMELLKQRKLDCMSILTFEEDTLTINRLCAENHIQQVFLGKVPTAVCVRKGHPLLEKMNTIAFSKDWRVLKPYNYVYYGHLNNENESLHTYKTLNIPHSGLILIPDTEQRLRIVSETDAFSAGAQHKKAVLEQYGLAEIPISDIQFNANCYFREQEGERDEIKHFIRLLREEFSRT